MSVPGPLDSRWKLGLVLLTLFLLVSSVGGVLFEHVGVGIAIALCLTLIVLLLRRRPGSDEGETHDVWDVIPSWQYAGRHVESGGLARNEQERALADVQQQAEEQVTEQPPR